MTFHPLPSLRVEPEIAVGIVTWMRWLISPAAMLPFVKKQSPLPVQLDVPGLASMMHGLLVQFVLPVGETFVMYILAMLTVVPPRLFTGTLNPLLVKFCAPGFVGTRFSAAANASFWLMERSDVL